VVGIQERSAIPQDMRQRANALAFFCTNLREPFKGSRTHVVAVRVITLEREYHIITSDMFMTWQHNKFSIIIPHNILFVTPSSFIIKFEPIQKRLPLIQNQHKCKLFKSLKECKQNNEEKNMISVP